MSETLTLDPQTVSGCSDEQLVALCQRQWPRWGAAFTALVKRYQQPVYRACLVYLRHEADAAEACQAVFVRLWRHLSGFEGRSSFRTWLYRIVYNQCHSVASSRARRMLHEPIDDWAQLLAIFDTDTALALEAEILVKQALSTLGESDREVLQRRFYQEQTLEQIARELGIGLSAAKMRLYRALERFKGAYLALA